VLARSARPHWLVSAPGRPQQDWAVWQWDGHARVHGVRGEVDLDVARLRDLEG
jgi:GH25 family lysozyme M1 (1,4-beta-N-acetylmuramidase)